MKKIILSALVAVASLSANAQVWLGGDLGFGFTKAYKGAKTANTIKIAPEIGYMFSENWGVYADIAFQSEKAGYEGAKAKNCFGFDVAARWVFAKTGIASFFLDGGVGMDIYNNNGGNVFDVKIIPGVKFAASDHVSVVAKIGGIGAAFANEKAQAAGNGDKTAFGLNVNNTDLSLGVYYNF
jgi:hypothetical protein